MKYVADDGTEFKTEAECVAYENTHSNRLFDFVTEKIEAEYNDDAGFSIITEKNVVDFIETHFKEICEILGSPKEDSDGWISNVGRNRWAHPESLSRDTKIEVKYRDGTTETGLADSWNASWAETDGYPMDIVAYRILKG